MHTVLLGVLVDIRSSCTEILQEERVTSYIEAECPIIRLFHLILSHYIPSYKAVTIQF